MLARTFQRSLGSVLLLILITSLSQAAPLILTGDTYTSRLFLTQNNGGSANLYVGNGNTAFLQFSFSSFPSGTASAEIAKATLVLYVNRVNTPGLIWVCSVSGEWNEALLTQRSAPRCMGVPAGPVSIVSPRNFISIDVTDLVKASVDLSAAKFAVAVSASPSAPGTFVWLDSKENTHPAVLDVQLTGPQGPAGPQGAIGPIGPQGPTGPMGPAGQSVMAPPTSTEAGDFWSTVSNPFILNNEGWTHHSNKSEFGDVVANMSPDVNWANWGRTVIANDGSNADYGNTALNVTSFANNASDLYGAVIEVALDPSNVGSRTGGVDGVYVELDTPTPDRLVNPAKIPKMSGFTAWGEIPAPISELYGFHVDRLGATSADEVIGVRVNQVYNTGYPDKAWAIKTNQGKVEFGDRLIVHGNVDATGFTVNGQPFVGAVGPMGPQGLTGQPGLTGPQGPAGPVGPAGSPTTVFSFGSDIGGSTPGSQFFNVMTGARSNTETANEKVLMPIACTVDSLTVVVDTAPSAASESFTLRWGNSPFLSSSSLSCVIAGSSQSCSATGAVSINPGDFLGMQLTVADSDLPIAQHVWVSFVCR